LRKGGVRYDVSDSLLALLSGFKLLLFHETNPHTIFGACQESNAVKIAEPKLFATIKANREDQHSSYLTLAQTPRENAVPTLSWR
jgi:hypothetical protein